MQHEISTCRCTSTSGALVSPLVLLPQQLAVRAHLVLCNAAKVDGLGADHHQNHCGSCHGRQEPIPSHRQRYQHLQQQQLRLQQRKRKQVHNLQQQHQVMLQQTQQQHAALDKQDHHPQSEQHHSDLPWYNQPHPEQLRDILTLPPYRFQTFIQQEPSILSFQPNTLSLTLEALSSALHANRKAVVSILEERPGILLCPHEPVMVLHKLAQLLQRSTEETAFLLAPYPQLLSLAPQQLQQRIQALSEVMHWPTQDLDALQQTAAAAGVSFLHLLWTPLHLTAQQLTGLAAALDTLEETCALLVQQQPHLLQMSPAVLRSRLFALADAASCSCSTFLQELDSQQISKLAGLLLLNPARLQEQISCLHRLLGEKQPGNVIVRLLLHLGSSHAVADAQVKWVALTGLLHGCEVWQQELLQADEHDLAAYLSVSHEGLAQVRYVVGAGLAESCGLRLSEVVRLPPAEFKQRFGQQYVSWLAGKGL